MIYSLILCILPIIIATVVNIVYLLAKRNSAKLKIYSDSDLLLIQEADHYRLTGFYLLKAGLYDAIQINDYNHFNAVFSDIFVYPHTSASRCDYHNFLKENPQINKIISYIESQNSKVSVGTIVSKVSTAPIIHSDGGKFVADCLKCLDKWIKILYVLAGIAIAYPGITKLMMGIYNYKPVDNLIGISILILFVFFLSAGICYALKKFFTKHLFVRHIMEHKSQIFKTSSFENETMSDEDISCLLRAYALCEFDKTKIAVLNNHYKYYPVISAAVSAAQIAAENAKKASSSSGCSGCSSCSSCGGCGGCGGCGD